MLILNLEGENDEDRGALFLNKLGVTDLSGKLDFDGKVTQDGFQVWATVLYSHD